MGGSSSSSESTPVNLQPLTDILGPELGARALEFLQPGAITDQFAFTGGPSPTDVSLSPEELASLQRLSGASGGGIGSSPFGAATLQALQSSLGPIGVTPETRAAIAAAQEETTRAFQRGTEGVRSGFTQAGQDIRPGASSPFEQAQAIRSEGLARELSNIATNFAAADVSQQRAARSQAISQGLAAAEQQFGREIQNLAAQALPRLQQTLNIQQAQAELDRQLQAIVNILSLVAGIQQPVIGTRSESESAEGHLL